MMARHFDPQQQQYCQIESNLGLTDPPFWVAAWIFPESLADQTIWFLGDNSADGEFRSLSVRQSGTVWIRDWTLLHGAAWAETAQVVQLLGWHHVMGIWAATNDRRVYLNGAEASNTDQVPVGPLNRACVGRMGDLTPSEYFSGRIAEVVVGTGVPSAAQVAALAGGLDPRLVIPSNWLVAWWRFLADDADLLGRYPLAALNSPGWADHVPLVQWHGPHLGLRPAAPPGGTLPPYRVATGQSWALAAAAGGLFGCGTATGSLFVPGKQAGAIHG